MYPRLAHIYGPLYIQTFGLVVVIGILVSSFLFLRHPKRSSFISNEQFFNALGWIIASVLIGAHIFNLITEPEEITSWIDVLMPWTGISVLGGVIGGLVGGFVYLKYYNIPIIPLFDIASIYIPLFQCFGRIGCFFAGCCHGHPTHLPWAITYTNQYSQAPLCIPLHPSQLYSAVFLGFIFFLMYFVLQYVVTKPGQLFSIYLMLISLERFMTDFWRFDHAPVKIIDGLSMLNALSINQWASLVLGICGLAFFIHQSLQVKKRRAA